MTATCEACGQPLAPASGLGLPRIKARILNTVRRHPGIDAETLRALVWFEDANGGPEDRKVLHVHIHQLNRQLAPHGLAVAATDSRLSARFDRSKLIAGALGRGVFLSFLRRAVMPVLFRDYESSICSRPHQGRRPALRRASLNRCMVLRLCCRRRRSRTVAPGDPVPAAFIAAATDPAWLASAFNAGFERYRAAHHGAALRLPADPARSPTLHPSERRSHALPRKLENVALALSLPQQKDKAGAAIMREFAMPRKPRPGEDPDGGSYWGDDPVQLQKLYAYCRQDVRLSARYTGASDSFRRPSRRFGSSTPVSTIAASTPIAS